MPADFPTIFLFVVHIPLDHFQCLNSFYPWINRKEIKSFSLSITVSWVSKRPQAWRIFVSKDCTPRETRLTPLLNQASIRSLSRSLTLASMVISQSLDNGRHSLSFCKTRLIFSGDRALGVPPPKNTHWIGLACTMLSCFAQAISCNKCSTYSFSLASLVWF